MISRLFAILGVALAMLASPALARDWDRERSRFELLDTQTVDARDDRIVFRVGRHDHGFEAIRFRARDDLTVGGIEIEYKNRERQRMNLYGRIGAGQETQVIDLAGESRRIETVTLFKRPSFRPGRTTVELVGIEFRGPPPPPPPRFEVVDTQTINARDDRILFRVGRREGRFEAIKFRARDDVTITGFDVEYARGERQRFNLFGRLERGQESQGVDLKGDSRRIENVVVYVRPGFRPRPVTLELLALEGRGGDRGHDRGDRDRRDRDEWVLLGQQKAGLFSRDTDAIPVGERAGRFKAIRLVAKRGAIRIFGARVIYGNGESEEVPVSAELVEGESSKPFDLKGRERFIDRVVIKYRSKLTLRGEGVIELFGLK